MRLFNLVLSILIAFPLFAQQFSISGRVKDASNGETLLGATILIEGGGGAVTNEYGFYSVTLDPGTYNITYKYLGYDDVVKKIILDDNKTVNIELGEKANVIGAAVVSAKAIERRVENKKISVVK